MPDFDFRVGSDAPTEGGGALRSVEDVLARAERLIDSPRPYDGYPLEWHVEAWNVGDLTAIAMVALRAPTSKSAPDPS